MKKGKTYILLFLILLFSEGVFAQHADEKLAAQYVAEGEYAKAAVIYEKLYQKTPTTYYYTTYLDCLFALEEYRKAERLVKRHQELNRNSRRFDVELGYVYLRAGDKDKAEKQFNTLLKQLPSADADIYEIADAFINRNLFEWAANTYLRARRNARNAGTYAFELAGVYERMGNYQAMVSEYLLRIDTDPNSVDDVQNRLQILIANDINGTFTNIVKDALLEKTQKSPQNLLYPQMLYWLSIQLKDFPMALVQAKSLDRRLRTEGDLVYNLATIMVANQEYDIALSAYDYLMSNGRESMYYLGARVRWLDVKFLKISTTSGFSEDDIQKLALEYKATLAEFGTNRSTLPLIRNYAHLQAFYMGATEEAVLLLEEALKIQGASAVESALNKLELADVYLAGGEIWEASLLYSQVEKAFKNDTIGHYAKFRNARLSFYIGEFEWALAQLEILRAATTKLIANDAMDLSLRISDNIDYDSSYVPLWFYARAELMVFQRNNDDALVLLDSILALFPGHLITDDVLYRKAEVYVQKHDFLNAARCFQGIVDGYHEEVWGDDALFRLAELYETPLKDPSRAAELYRQLLTDFPGSMFANEARKRFRNLRQPQGLIP
jgi:tetratricopeptide (TPR) repeat protein